MLPNRILTQTIYFPSNWSELSKNIQEKYKDDYFITSIRYGGGAWILIMSKVEGWNGQSYFCSKEFPHEKLKEYREKDYYLTSITHDGSDWICVVTGVNNCRGQVVYHGTWGRDLMELNKKAWDAGMIITSVSAEMYYAIVYSLFQERIEPGCLFSLFMKPTYKTIRYSQSFIDLDKPIGVREIQRCCKEDQVVIDIHDMNSIKTAVVTAGGLEYTKQRIHKAKSFKELDKLIDNRWAEGYCITSVEYTYDNEWILVFSK